MFSLIFLGLHLKTSLINHPTRKHNLSLFLSHQDRHNGNILIDEAGHLIHIDFGFLLGISPAKNMGFEVASFKLTGEMVELLGGDSSELYRWFVTMAVRGFLAARQVMTPILAIISSFADSGLPCFLHKANNLNSLRSRFVPDLTSSEAGAFMSSVVSSSRSSITTRLYDGIQKAQNGIYAPEW